MRVPLAKTCGCLVVVLILAGVDAGAVTRSAPEQSPAAGPPQEKAATPATPPPEQSEEPRRPTRRSGRTSSRQTSPAAIGPARAARTSRVAGPTQQNLTLTASLVGGYDDNLIGRQGTRAGFAPTAMASGSMGRLDTTLDYRRGNRRHSIGIDSTGNLLAYPSYLERPAVGGAAAVDVMSTLGRDTTLSASERLSYDPFFNVFQTSAGDASQSPAVDQVSPVTGLFERRSLSSRSAVSMEHPWSRRDSSTLSYAYGVRRFVDGDNGDSTTHVLAAGYRRTLSTDVRARMDYRYMDLANVGADGVTRPTGTHRVEGGADIEQGLSRHRRLTWTLLAGAAHIESLASNSRIPYSAWIPTGSASARLALSPSWNVEGSYRRDFALLQGITSEVYATDTASLTTGGVLTSRVDLLVGGTYGNWRTPAASTVTGTFDVYGGLVQVHVRLNATVTAMAGYNYYHHRFSDPAQLPAGFPPTYDRHAVRFGIGVRVPLLATRAPQSAAPR